MIKTRVKLAVDSLDTIAVLLMPISITPSQHSTAMTTYVDANIDDNSLKPTPHVHANLG